jgi:hypothetical protein
MTLNPKLLPLILVLLAPAASAADFHFYGGGSYISGEASEIAADGWDFGIGGISNRGGDGVAWRWDWGFDGHDMRPQAITNALADDGDVATTFLRFGPQWDFEGYGSRFYVNAMVGYYWSWVNTSVDVLVPGIICDPYWGWCWNALVPGVQILEERTANDWGYSATMGYEWDMGEDASWFIEVQFHQARQGEGYAFAPLVIGIRF